ncbi:hypothetical protein HKK80_12165 [Halonotius sp. F2-221B]|uniref:hypothetical protein n=1 Tax=Halonotius sp. F2-221B TaxID=2731620 RepID=UPI00398A59EF
MATESCFDRTLSVDSCSRKSPTSGNTSEGSNAGFDVPGHLIENLSFTPATNKPAVKHRQRVEHFRTDLLNWAEDNLRSFPWRDTTDLAEIPLAEADVTDSLRNPLTEIWQELGWNVNLHYDEDGSWIGPTVRFGDIGQFPSGG